MNKNISPIAASVMTFNGLAMIEAAQQREVVLAEALETPEGKRAIVDQIQQALFTTLKPRLGDPE